MTLTYAISFSVSIHGARENWMRSRSNNLWLKSSWNQRFRLGPWRKPIFPWVNWKRLGCLWRSIKTSSPLRATFTIQTSSWRTTPTLSSSTLTAFQRSLTRKLSSFCIGLSVWHVSRKLTTGSQFAWKITGKSVWMKKENSRGIKRKDWIGTIDNPSKQRKSTNWWTHFARKLINRWLSKVRTICVRSQTD